MKIKIVSLIIAILLILMYVPVYADITIPPLPTDGLSYWCVANVGTSNYVVLNYLTSHNPIKVWKPNNKQLRLDTYKIYSYQNNEWVLIEEGMGGWPVYIDTIYAANHDIAYAEGSDDFFFECPKVYPLVQTMEATDFGKILKNFSAGLIPIVGLIVSLIAFRKAWAFLRSQLQS